jgi:ATP-dependent helicase/nuclease subunit A
LNTAQLLAADPKVSAWVAASAGTGKTKVLTDRILNLLLHGVTPERILCLTFTKAAASEMANRLMKRLAQWAIIPELDLTRELKGLLGDKTIALPLVSRARKLFSLVLDVPGGMKIQTIHGFCQTILGRFPLEAGVSPHFRILDEVLGEDILLQAQHKVFADPSPMAQRALDILNPFMEDLRFKDFCNGRSRIMSLLGKYDNFWSYVQRVIEFMEIKEFVSQPEELLDPELIPRLKAQSFSTDMAFEDYINIYLTQKGEIRKKLSPEQAPEAQRIYEWVQRLSALEIAQRTVAMLILVQDTMNEYQDRKLRQGVLDYDDLIQKAYYLLMQSEIASWVLYKLDGGIDHLLIDEAQDTNTLQWDIILSLTQEFYSHSKSNRTIFAVGDAKQSIYSFQGANPEDFVRLKGHYAKLAQAFEVGWRDVQLELSYRSTAAILAIVDEVFKNDQTRQGVSFGQEKINHHVFREVSSEYLPGLVKLWPLVEAEANEKVTQATEWRIPLERVERRSPQYLMAEFLAEQVAGLISSKGILHSTNQAIQPKDILILVRKRGEISDEIIHALKKRNIPVAGSDRLVLTDYIAVMDLLALGQFVLLPDDDLNLACILRSPLIGLSEEDLFTLAHDREGTLWSSLTDKSSLNASLQFAHNWLSSCLHEAELSLVYEFYNWVLTQGGGRQRFLSRLGYEVEDVIDEFLSQCLNYEREQTGSLQGFVQFVNGQSQEIKRDSSDTVNNQVRLMTVHGSKGLQAPIVILPDAGEMGREKWDPLLWYDDVVLFRPTDSQDTTKTREMKNVDSQRKLEEKNRLLYVALTRAQDQLYIGGWIKKGKELADDSWYRLIQQAIENKAGTTADSHSDHIYLTNIEKITGEAAQNDTVIPEWVTRPYMEDSSENLKLNQKNSNIAAAKDRGILIHRFFEYLPHLNPEHRYKAACQIIEKEGLPITDWESDIQATLEILTNPTYANFFDVSSLAEVPLAGMIDGMPFQGRIDRLTVTEDTITIIDFKTSRDFPKKTDDIPPEIIKQLEGYEAALRTIYPEHNIRKILLWTAGPVIQEIP